ncbi:MAG TPA: helix-turn-helix domain-containing protein, partial [Gemmataceae bacterium]
MATTNSGTTTGKPVNEILTLPEAASYLRVGEDVLRQLASEQKIPARKIGEEWRFLKSALQDWLRRGLPLD